MFVGEIGLGIIHADLYSRIPVLIALLLFPVVATVANHLAKLMITEAGMRTNVWSSSAAMTKQARSRVP